jgi:Transposase IS200 like
VIFATFCSDPLSLFGIHLDVRGKPSSAEAIEDASTEPRSILLFARAIRIASFELAKACCEMSRRDVAIVAWHEVPGTAPPQKSRPVGYGVIRAGVRTDSMIGVMKFRLIKAGSSAWIHQTFPNLRNFAWQQGYGAFSVGISQVQETVHYIEQQLEHHRTRTFQEEYLAFLKKHGAHFDEKYLWD